MYIHAYRLFILLCACWYLWSFMWLLQPTWWAEFHWSPCSWLVTQPLPFLTSTASTKIFFLLPSGQLWHCSSGWPAWQQYAWGKVLVTSGCGSLDVASRAWVVCHVRRLMTWGRRLLCRRGACAEPRLAGVARLIGPDGKWSVVVKLYRRVCTMYKHIYTFMNVYVPCTYIYMKS